jgi:cytochrome c oxidase subunit 4
MESRPAASQSSHGPSGHAAAGGHHGVGHLVPVSLLFGVLMLLLVLTAITVWLSGPEWQFSRGFGIVIALVLATVKASLVALYFMHLRWDRPFNGLVLLFSFFLLALFLGLALLDTRSYHDSIETYRAAAQPGEPDRYAPELQR